MTVGVETFQVREWAGQVPNEFPDVKARLKELEKSKTLKKTLDHLIAVTHLLEKALKENAAQTTLIAIKNNCLKLIGIIANQPTVTYEDVLAIEKRRQIDPDYLPKHLSDEDLAREAEIPQNETEKKRRQIYRLRRFALLGKAYEGGKLLKLEPAYFNDETLPKAVLAAELNIEPDQVWSHLDKMKQQLNDFIQKSTLAEAQQTFIADELTKHYRRIRERLQSELTANKSIQLLIPQTTLSFLDFIRFYERQIAIDWTAIKHTLKGAVHPNLQKYYQTYKAKNAFLFDSRVNRLLRTNYLNEEGREPFRLHIFKGKFYQILRQGGNLTIRPFCSMTETSHLKEGWISIVMNSRGELFGASHKKNRILHSSFMSGGPVLFAGEVQLASDGTLMAVSNYSGHYGTLLTHMRDFAVHLNARGVNVSRCDFFELNTSIKHRTLEKLRTNGVSEELLAEYGKRLSNKEQTLEYSHRLRFKHNQLVPSLKPAIKLALRVVAAIIAVALLLLIIVASHGAGMPLVTPILVKLAALAGTSFAVIGKISLAISSLIAAVTLFVTAKGMRLFSFIADRVHETKLNLNAKLSSGMSKKSTPHAVVMAPAPKDNAPKINSIMTKVASPQVAEPRQAYLSVPHAVKDEKTREATVATWPLGPLNNHPCGKELALQPGPYVEPEKTFVNN